MDMEEPVDMVYSLKEEKDDLVTEEGIDIVTEESTVTITEESSDPDFVMEGNSSVAAVTNKLPYKRKLPRKKGRRKQFSRPKRHSVKIKTLLSVLTPEVVVKEEEETEDIALNCDSEAEELTNNDESEGITAQETLKHSPVFVLPEQPPSIDGSVVKQPAQNPTIRVRKVLLHRKINRSGVTVFTPVLSKVDPVLSKPIQVSTYKIPWVKPVLQKSIQKPVLSSGQPEQVTLQPKIDHSYFIDESNCQDAHEESSVSMDNRMADASENIPVTTYTTSHQKNSAVPHTAQPGNIQSISHIVKSGKIPTLSLVAQPGNVPALALLAQPGISPAISLLAQRQNLPAFSLVSQPGNIPTVSQVAKPGNILTVCHVAQPGKLPTASHAAQPTNIPTVSHVAQPANIPTVSHVAQPGNVSGSTEIPTISRPTLFNGIPSPNISLANRAVQPAESFKEQPLEIVGKKLMETIPAPWITVLRTNGIALCLLNQADIVTIRRSMLIETSGKITVGVHGKQLPSDNPYWNRVTTTELRPDNIDEFVTKVHRNFILLRGMEVCRAVEEFQPFWKNMENCEIDQNRFHEMRFNLCCRSTSCQLLVPNLRNKRCIECSKVWKTLSRRSLVDSKKPESLSLHKPFKYLTSPEKRERFDRAVKDLKNLKLVNKRLTEKLNQVLHPEAGVPAGSLVNNDSDDAEMSDNSENVL